MVIDRACNSSHTHVVAGFSPRSRLHPYVWAPETRYRRVVAGDHPRHRLTSSSGIRSYRTLHFCKDLLLQGSFYWQDSWKTTRNLTLDYGLRWDYASVPKEQYGRSANLGLVPNPAAGNAIGAAVFQATCHCDFVHSYPYALGPRIGFAYQFSPKTVVRGGWGFIYGFAPDINVSTSANQTNTPVGTNAFANVSTAGALPQPVWPNFDPGQTPLPGQITGFTGFTSLDRNAARPPRQNQYSIGIEREMTRDLVFDASYVGNRGVWWAGPLGYSIRCLRPDSASFGLNPFNNPDDNLLLSSPLSSPQVIARIGNFLPYPGYSTSNTLLNALRPFPQFSTITVTNSPTGNTWYDSLQMKLTKRMSKGLQVNGTYTFSKAFVSTRQDLFNPASSSKSIQATDQPHVLSMNILYQTQKYFGSHLADVVTRDWQIGAFLQYASGLPLTPPTATTTNNLPGGNEMVPHRPAALSEGPQLPLLQSNHGSSAESCRLDQSASRHLRSWSDFRLRPEPAVLGFPRTAPSFRESQHRPRFPDRKRGAARDFFDPGGVLQCLQQDADDEPDHDKSAGCSSSGQLTGGFGVINEVFATGSFPSGSMLPRQGTLVGRITF